MERPSSVSIVARASFSAAKAGCWTRTPSLVATKRFDGSRSDSVCESVDSQLEKIVAAVMLATTLSRRLVRSEVANARHDSEYRGG
jgi:hypothetical protein